ncbi:hypothetical protein K439DRAFT_1628887 [Ramaria rubella]|nr:hypothetical protein K439DRAFT_1628887 [Ramaria rubella]
MECEAASEYGAGPILVTSLNQSYLTVLIQPAIYTVMFYDYFLTFDDEVKYVWPSKWTLAKSLYFATTYTSFMNLVVSVPGFLTACTRMPRTITVTAVEFCLSLITICTAESVLLFRTWVLWESRKRTAIGLLGLFTFLVISSTIFVAFGIRQLKQDVAGSQPVVGSINFFSFPLLAFYESVMLGLNIYKAKQYFTPAHNRYISLAVVLLRDGILYYIFVLSISLTVTGFLITANKPLLIQLSALHVILHSVLTKRMFLSLRSVASQDFPDSWVPNSTFVAISRLQFYSWSDISIEA